MDFDESNGVDVPERASSDMTVLQPVPIDTKRSGGYFLVSGQMSFRSKFATRTGLL